MPSTMQIRGLADVGVITDVAPSNLPPNALTKAKNVRFDEGSVVRAPVFRRVHNNLAHSARLVLGTIPASGHGTVISVSDDFQIYEYANSLVTNRSGSITPLSGPSSATATNLANIVYINRKDKLPAYRYTANSNFLEIPTGGTGWDASWRAGSIRAYGDFLIALNMKEGPNSKDNRVRWSDLALADGTPPQWDSSSTTNSAGFNDLVQMQSGIVDGLSLGPNFIIYSKDQVWTMDFVGGVFIFNFRKLFTESGLINQNCAVEVDGRHFCFGTDDIYTHDGNSKTSIADQRVKTFIFNTLSNDKTNVCFTHHNPRLEEVYFCYNSTDDMTEFPGAQRCNRAAVFNYKNNTWSFIDLPNVSGAALASLESSLTYATATDTYAVIGGTYHSQEANFALHNVFVGDTTPGVITSPKLYVLDGSVENTLVSFPLDTLATKSPLLERVGIDLDESVDLTGYKVITKVVPQIHTDSTNKQFNFNFGAANLISGPPTYEPTITFDTSLTHKIDTRAAGRYLSYKMAVSDNKDFKYIGFDVDVTATGRR